MKHFWTFYQGIDELTHPFGTFTLAHFIYLTITVLLICLILKHYKRCDIKNKITWQRAVAIFFLFEESFYYLWILFQCQENVFFEVLSLELCSICSILNITTLFHQNKQVRFFCACMGIIGGPIAMIYPATIANIYPVISYRTLNFFLSHGAYIVFSLMILEDKNLLNRKRLLNNMLICACILTFVYFFDLKFNTQYMFVGTPPEIPFIRLAYDIVGQTVFLPLAIFCFSALQFISYIIIKNIQRSIYPYYE